MKNVAMELGSLDNRVSKKSKVVKSNDEQARMGDKDKSTMSNEAKVNRSSEPHSCVRVKTSAMEQAEEIRSNLSPEFPSFSKPVLKTHVSNKFRFYLPRNFMVNLPSHDYTVVLVDEYGKEYQAKYSTQRHSIDGGRSGFSRTHKLLEGDALVFHLIDYCKFKVYIVRATEANETLTLPKSDVHAKTIDTDDQLVSDTDNLSSVLIPKSPKFSDKFKEVSGFEDFKIIVGGLILDSEIPTNMRRKYYELCCSQMMFVHDNLVEGLSSKLAVDMISETINIIDAIRAANIATSLHNLKCWDKTLEGFEVLGMSVGFLRARLHKLIRISCESQGIFETKREKKARLDDELEALKAAVLKVKEFMNNLESELFALEVKNEKLGFEFMEVAGAT